MEKGAIEGTVDRAALKRRVFARYVLSLVALAAIFFLPAGTLNYWQGWAYMAVLLLPMAVVMMLYLRKDPALLERRLRTKEKVRKQRAAVFLTYPVFFATFLLPGLDRRWGWSSMPVWLTIAADAIVLACYLLFMRVLKENRFLSRVVEVVPGQRVIDSGPYAKVRHPMYAALIPLYLFSPLALGSFWALIPAALLPPIIVFRITNEEKLLSRELCGYRKYARRVHYRLIPKVW
ncbi:MAG: isoprenylcysteine carboxylmethyltransferase family protein [Candidatus Aminicenantes bacterium]|nr:isoprenylcysteine carboxylmethyltransferase family protein [Candidatus Aminicenantes bacterium]